MFIDIVLTSVVLALAAMLGWLAWRAWHASNPFARWGGGILASLLTLVVAAVGVMAAVGLTKWLAPPATAVPDLKVAGTPQQVERGRYIANSLCVDCHTVSHQLPLSGGQDMSHQISIPVGSFTPPNLTPAGSLQEWTDGEIFRALRTGVDDEGHHMVIMSTVAVRNLSDEDIQAVIAFLRTQPAVENKTPDPADQPNFLALVLYGGGMLPGGPPPVTDAVTAPAKAPTTEYGKYVVSYSGCRDCHGSNLAGADPKSLAAHGPSLRVVKGWTVTQFISTLRTGVDPTGHALSTVMPWKVMGRLDDSDLTAVYQYLTSLQ